MIIQCLVVLFLCGHMCKSANILVLAPFPGKSHHNVLSRIVKELATRGHEVDFLSHFPLKKPIPRYNDLSVRGTLPILVNNVTLQQVEESTPIQQLWIILEYAGATMCQSIFNSKTAHDLKNSMKKYDLIIIHYFATNCMLGFTHLFSIPSVAIITSVNLSWISSAIGLPDNPSYIPNYFMPYLPHMTFFQRFSNTLIYVISKIGFHTASNVPSNIIAREFFGPDLPNVEVLARNISLVMTNSHFSVNQARPTVPNFIEIGGVHIDANTSLNTHFKESMETDTKGIIYLSFGSMVLTNTFPEATLKAFFQIFKHLPYKVMWKGSKEKFPEHLEIPNNIQFEPWMPQMGILCHPNVKLFISHGGMLGTLEALYCGVPILGVPIFGDQLLNVRTSESKGVAIGIPLGEITEKKLSHALKSLLFDPRYKDNCEKISKLFKDRPTSALDTAIYWIEYVIRHNGAAHLRSIAADLPWYQYHLVDVIGTCILLALIIVYSVYRIFCFILCSIKISIPIRKGKKE